MIFNAPLVWAHLWLVCVNLWLAFIVFCILNLSCIHFCSMKGCTRGRVHQRLSENISRICRLGILTHKQKTAKASLICTAHGCTLIGLVCGRVLFHSFMHYFSSQEIICTCAFHRLSFSTPLLSHFHCPQPDHCLEMYVHWSITHEEDFFGWNKSSQKG